MKGLFGKLDLSMALEARAMGLIDRIEARLELAALDTQIEIASAEAGRPVIQITVEKDTERSAVKREINRLLSEGVSA